MKLATLAVGATIGLIMITSILVPVISGVSEDPQVLEVIILDGQSNAEYNTALITSVQGDLPLPHHKLYYYGSETKSNMYPGYADSEMRLMNRDNTWIVSGIEAPLAYHYSVRSGHDVYIVNIARGGASIETLRPDGSNGNYGKQVLSQALSEIPDYYSVRMAGWVMIQGEADKEMPISEYKAYFMELADYFDSIGAEKCYISATRAYYGGNATIAQNELASENHDIIMASTASESFNVDNRLVKPNDPIHYSQAGRNIIAKDIAYSIELSPVSSSFKILGLIPIFLAIALIVPIVGSMVTSRRE